MSTLLVFLCLLSLISSAPLLVSAAKCNPDDKRALIQFRADWGNPYTLISWNTPGAGGCCDWPGVGCDDATSRVVSLSVFDADEITLPIPSSVANFPFLTSLTLRKLPNVTGPIPPAIGTMTKLTFLWLDWNSLTGPVPSFLARLTSLNYLNLSFNKLTGTIPAFLADLPLGFLRLDRNRLTGGIPESLARSSSTYLYLSHNNLTGAIPPSFAANKFEVVDLSRNQLSGDASVLFGSSKPLQQLDLSRNGFAFDLTPVAFPENMTWLIVDHNKIYGAIPPAITKLALQNINVSYNRLCGEIPNLDLERFDKYSFFHNRCLCGSPLPAC